MERERRREELTRLRLVDSRLREELENHRRSDQRHLQIWRVVEIINISTFQNYKHHYEPFWIRPLDW